MGWKTTHNARRTEIRKNRPDKGQTWQRLRAEGVAGSVVIAIVFWMVASGIVMLRAHVVPYRPGQYVPHAIVSRVDFTYRNKDRLTQARSEARESQPRIYVPAQPDVFTQLQETLLLLPDKVSGAQVEELGQPLASILEQASITRLQHYAEAKLRPGYEQAVRDYVQSVRDLRLVIVDPRDRQLDLPVKAEIRWPGQPLASVMDGQDLLTLPLPPNVQNQLRARVEKDFVLDLQPKILKLTEALLKADFRVDEEGTAEARNRAAEAVPSSVGDELKPANMVLVERGRISDSQWQLLRAENEQYLQSLDDNGWKTRIGLAAMMLIITLSLAGYVARFQPRVIRNHGRGIAIAALMISMLLVAEIAAMGSSPIFFSGVAPTILVAMILATAYDQRFALGLGTIHALIITIGLGQTVPFFIILWIGVLVSTFLLDEIRTRSKLVEIGGLTALALMAASAASGLLAMDPLEFIGRNALYTGAAGLASGFMVLGVLPFIERAFRITTGVTLLELADANQPLLRRLAIEAPGTYNHSLQVANLAEEAADVIGANSLLCRVAAYYHDVGKINKSDYFVENQVNGQNRHLNLSPSVSLLIIIGHVKDGIELAKEYNLPTSLLPFIQQHHGTTLVEFFYHQACTMGKQDPDQPQISEMQYRYPGPKPKSREIAILMLADAAESACRSLPEPSAARIEALVHELAMKRFTDGQFDECDLTMRDLEMIERSLSKTLLGIYHGRIAYPSSRPAPAPVPAARTA